MNSSTIKHLLLASIILNLNCLCCNKKAYSSSEEAQDVFKLGEVYAATSAFESMIGINGFEWEYLNNSNKFDQKRFELIKTFSGFRHYLDWEKIEPVEGMYNMLFYDQIYKENAENGIASLVCLQIMPTWMRKTYTEYDPLQRYKSLRDYTPVPSGSDKSVPASYISMAKVGFQMAARYGNNKDLDQNLIRSAKYERPVKFALNLVNYIECSNEPDKNWAGSEAHQTPEEYAAQLSAFYDGHMGSLGKDAGVKNAAPNVKVVMAGIASPDPEYVKRIIDWCKANRVKNGKYSICFDVINYHNYSRIKGKNGKAPELSDIGATAEKFVKFSKNYAGNMPVWVTECGFDVNPRSPQRAISIGTKNTYDTQADWLLRTSLLYARKGIERNFFYMLNDVDSNSPNQYSSSGLLENNTRRPAANFLFQTRKLMGSYFYKTTISADPLVDLYTLKDTTIYVLTIPDEKDRVAKYDLNLGGYDPLKAVLYKLNRNSENISSEQLKLSSSKKISLVVTETPMFVKVVTP
jgi:hypothetical protein